MDPLSCDAWANTAHAGCSGSGSCRSSWLVVGGHSQAGLIVREGSNLDSAQLQGRLGFGAVVEELEIVGGRLHYRKLSGEGPASGWVTLWIGSRQLLTLVAAPVDRAVQLLAGIAGVPTVLGKGENVAHGGKGNTKDDWRRRLSVPVAGRPWRVLCVGDSLTVDGYPPILARLLREGSGNASAVDAVVKDFGVRGASVVSGGHAIAYRQLPRLKPELRDRPPDAVVVMLGTNDAQPGCWNEKRFVREIELLLRLLRGDGPNDDSCRLLLCVVPPRATQNAWNVDPAIVDEDLPRAVRLVAGALDLPIFDPRNVLLHPRHLEDGVHLKRSGHEILAHGIHEALIAEMVGAGFPSASIGHKDSGDIACNAKAGLSCSRQEVAAVPSQLSGSKSESCHGMSASY